MQQERFAYIALGAHIQLAFIIIDITILLFKIPY